MYYTDKTILFLDNKWVKSTDGKTDLYSQTLHYGEGVFEGIRSYKTEKGTKLFKAKEHFERLHYSAQKMHIKIPYSIDELTSLSYELLKKKQFRRCLHPSYGILRTKHDTSTKRKCTCNALCMGMGEILR